MNSHIFLKFHVQLLEQIKFHVFYLVWNKGKKKPKQQNHPQNQTKAFVFKIKYSSLSSSHICSIQENDPVLLHYWNSWIFQESLTFNNKSTIISAIASKSFTSVLTSKHLFVSVTWEKEDNINKKKLLKSISI